LNDNEQEAMKVLCKWFGHKLKSTGIEKVMYGVYDESFVCKRCGLKGVFIHRPMFMKDMEIFEFEIRRSGK
jgi:hypothetical protein